jgi:hypothetical protein
MMRLWGAGAWFRWGILVMVCGEGAIMIIS